MMDRLLSVPLLALLFFPAAQAYSLASNGQYAGGDIATEGAFGLSNSSFTQLLSKPNLTAAYPFAGFDLTIPAGQFPQTDSTKSW